jgi:Saxitoxin biosynthesis operon protein SxtJ
VQSKRPGWKTITKDQSKDSGMALVLILLILCLRFQRKDLLGVAVALQLVNMAAPGVFKPFAIVWFGLSDLLGAVSSKVLMGLVFFIVVTPIGVLRRLAGKDSLNLRGFKADKESAMVTRNHLFTGADLERPY